LCVVHLGSVLAKVKVISLQHMSTTDALCIVYT